MLNFNNFIKFPLEHSNFKIHLFKPQFLLHNTVYCSFSSYSNDTLQKDFNELCLNSDISFDLVGLLVVMVRTLRDACLQVNDIYFPWRKVFSESEYKLKYISDIVAIKFPESKIPEQAIKLIKFLNMFMQEGEDDVLTSEQVTSRLEFLNIGVKNLLFLLNNLYKRANLKEVVNYGFITNSVPSALDRNVSNYLTNFVVGSCGSNRDLVDLNVVITYRFLCFICAKSNICKADFKLFVIFLKERLSSNEVCLKIKLKKKDLHYALSLFLNVERAIIYAKAAPEDYIISDFFPHHNKSQFFKTRRKNRFKVFLKALKSIGILKNYLTYLLSKKGYLAVSDRNHLLALLEQHSLPIMRAIELIPEVWCWDVFGHFVIFD